VRSISERAETWLEGHLDPAGTLEEDKQAGRHPAAATRAERERETAGTRSRNVAPRTAGTSSGDAFRISAGATARGTIGSGT